MPRWKLWAGVGRSYPARQLRRPRGDSSMCSLCAKWCRSAVVTLTSHMLYVTSQPAARLCLRPAPHHRTYVWRKSTDTLWRSSKWHGRWLLLIFLHCSSCCMYPWGRLSVATPVSQIGHFQFVFLGHGSPQSVTQFCVCQWALSGVAVMMQVDQF